MEILLKSIKCDYIKRVRELLENKADIHFQDEHGITLLMEACFYGEKEIVEILIDKGADVNVMNKA